MNHIAGNKVWGQVSGCIMYVWMFTVIKIIQIKRGKFSPSFPCNYASSFIGSSLRPCKEWAIDLSCAIIFAICMTSTGVLYWDTDVLI